MKAHIVIISPAMANANNGNWRTASRWARLLRQRYTVTIVSGDATDAVAINTIATPALIIALHARRSAPLLAALRARYQSVPILLALTGTDLYRDIHNNDDARHTLQLANRLVVLQDAGLTELSDEARAKTQVIYQSVPVSKPSKQAVIQRPRYFNVCMIGHLREEKDPTTFMRTAALLSTPRIRLLHIGAALDENLGAQAQATAKSQSNYHWLGALSHTTTRRRLQRSQLMVIASKMEGGAHVIIEAINAGVPVLASDISGNRGMLGDDYAGYFPLGDSTALANAIERAANDPDFLLQLSQQCQARKPFFAPAREQAALLDLVDNMLHQQHTHRISSS